MQCFEGIKVIDFTHVYAGPFATQQLAVMGAEVIKVEPVDNPDMMRREGSYQALNEQGLGTCYVFNNQGKKAISLNLATQQGQDIARKLIVDADVLVENYSGALDKYGLGVEAVHALNPSLIYCEMSGYGKQGKFANRPAYDPVIQASSGIMSLNGHADAPYLRVGPPLIDYGTGAQAAFAIASALFQRTRTGKGQHIEVNMQDAAMVMISPHIANAMQARQTDQRHGNTCGHYAGYGIYACSDADLMLGAFNERQQIKLMEIMGLDEDLDIPKPISHDWITENREALVAALGRRFAAQTADYWEEFLNQHDIPAARVRDLYEMLQEEQPKRASSSQFKRLEASELTAPIAAFRFAEHGPTLQVRCARHGEDNAEVLSSLGYSAEEIEQLAEQGVI